MVASALGDPEAMSNTNCPAGRLGVRCYRCKGNGCSRNGCNGNGCNGNGVVEMDIVEMDLVEMGI